MKPAPLQLDFAPGARRAAPGLGVLMLLICGLVLAVLSAAVAQQLASNTRQAETLAAVLARRGPLATESTESRREPPADAGELARLRDAQGVAARLATPWADLIGALEAATSPAVALLLVEPSAARRTMRLTGEARSAPDMLDYLSSLQRDARLARVVLVSHELQDKTPGAPLRFQIQAAWGEAP